MIKHHRTVSLPTGCALFHEPLRVSHERTRSAPLAGAHDDLLAHARPSEPDLERLAHARPAEPKKAWSRRASTGARLNKLSPAHSKSTYRTAAAFHCLSPLRFDTEVCQRLD